MAFFVVVGGVSKDLAKFPRQNTERKSDWEK